MKITETTLPKKTVAALHRAGLTEMKQLKRFTTDELAALHGIGKRSAEKITQTLREWLHSSV